MILVSEVRCSDCLNEFRAAQRFAVIKEDKSQFYSDEERMLGGHLYQVLVCADCSRWYDDAAPTLSDAQLAALTAPPEKP